MRKLIWWITFRWCQKHEGGFPWPFLKLQKPLPPKNFCSSVCSISVWVWFCKPYWRHQMHLRFFFFPLPQSNSMIDSSCYFLLSSFYVRSGSTQMLLINKKVKIVISSSVILYWDIFNVSDTSWVSLQVFQAVMLE